MTPYLVDNYIEAHTRLLSAFNCPRPYFVRPMLDSLWQVTGGEDISILTVDRQTAVVVRSEGQPLIYRADGYVLVIAIDCIKIAFLLREDREIAP